MENALLIAVVLGIHFLAWFTPGPLMALIIRNSLVYSRTAGVWTALGIGVGNLIHVLYSAGGASLLFSSSNSTVFTIVKYLGVMYITYLGLKTFQLSSRGKKFNNIEKHKDISSWQAFRTGFITNILSPKASLFFASIFASVYAAGAPTWVIVLLVAAMPANSVVMATLLSYFFTMRRVKEVYEKRQNVVHTILGSALLLLALMIIIRA